MNYFTIKNWATHQHYKDRNPPWIKMHQSVLDDYEFNCLQNDSKLLLMLIWIFASKFGHSNPRIPNDTEYLQDKLPFKGKVDLKPLYDMGFLILESNTLAECKQTASPETKTEEETEAEKYIPEKFFEADWEFYPRKAGSKSKAKKCYLKSVNTAEKRVNFLSKTREYISKTDPNFLKHGETWFRNWEDHEIAEPITAKSNSSGNKKLAQIQRLVKTNHFGSTALDLLEAGK